VGWRDLVVWSFLMASAHGAGLMALPFVPAAGASPGVERVTPAAAHASAPAVASSHHGSHHHASHVTAGRSGSGVWSAALATLVHALGYLAVTGAVAAVVYYRVGLRLLRKAWVNLDRIWAGALIATAVLVLLT
jgi:hypothetical protein